MEDTNNSDAVRADRIIIRMIAFSQLLMSLGGFLLLLIGSVYGGAGAYPERFLGILFYLFCGLVTALYLCSRSMPARVLALAWHAVFLGTVFWMTTRLSVDTTKGSSALESTVTISALSLIYLVISCWMKLTSAKSVAPL